MRDVWEDRRKSSEEEYFKKQNEEALASLKSKLKDRAMTPAPGSGTRPRDRLSALIKRIVGWFRPGS